MSTAEEAGAVAGGAPDPRPDLAGSTDAVSAGAASIPSDVAPDSAPPSAVRAAAAVTGAIDAGPAPAAPPTVGPQPFIGAAPSLSGAGQEPSVVEPGDQAAGPAPGMAYEGSLLTLEEGE